MQQEMGKLLVERKNGPFHLHTAPRAHFLPRGLQKAA